MPNRGQLRLRIALLILLLLGEVGIFLTIRWCPLLGDGVVFLLAMVFLFIVLGIVILGVSTADIARKIRGNKNGPS